MKKLLIHALLTSAGLTIATLSMAASPEMKANYKHAVDQAGIDYKQAKAQCASLSGNAKDVCVEEAKAAEKRAKAEAEAQYKNTPAARRDALIAAADGDYAVAKAKCAAKAGNDRDVCVKEAKAAQTKAVADAKANKKVGEARAEAREATGDANAKANSKSTEARNKARDETRDAQYKVAVEKCDALAGASKDTCVNAAKAKFGK